MTPRQDGSTLRRLQQDNEELRARLEEAEETLRAIREGEVDAVIVSGSKGDRVFSLTETENLHRLMVETMSEAGLALTPDGIILFCNARAAALLQRDRDQLVGRYLREFTANHDAQRLDTLIQSTETNVADDRVLFVAADGSAVPMRMWASRLHRAEGPIVCLVGTDLSQREARQDLIDQLQEQQQQLREAEELLRLAVEGADVAIWTSEEHGEMVQVSPGARELLGFEPHTELRRAQALELVHPDDRGRVAAALERTWATGEPLSIDYRVLLPDHRVRWVETRARRFDEGGVRRLYGLSSDITVLKTANEESRRRAEELQTLMDITPAAIVVAEDPECRRLTGNRAARDLYEAEELDNLIPGSGRRFLRQGRELSPQELPLQMAAAERREIRDVEVDVELPSGRRRTIWGHATPLFDSSGKVRGCIAAFADLTDRKRAEEALKAARDSAERAKADAESATRAKDHFLAVLSHELRTPLAPVLTGISLLEMEVGGSEQAREYLEIIRRNVELESRLIDDLLDLTRISQGRVELHRRRHELSTIIERAVEVCRADIAARRLHFGVDWQVGPCLVEADAARLQQVFWNLLKNAIKFTPKDGCVGIRGRMDQGAVAIEINDSGIGIDAAALPGIFDAFSQAEPGISRQFGGLGLGLAISKALVEMHGGTIQARSEGRSKGATFTVRLPISMEADAGRERNGGLPRAETRGQAFRILLVEDHGDTAVMTVRVLKFAGHEVQTAGDVATALQAIDREPFDLLISDLGLPDRSGLDLIREIRARGKSMPAIALSGYGQLQDVERSRAAGFELHLVKPVEPSRLIDAIQSLARGATG